jgi:hypothetical protein
MRFAIAYLLAIILVHPVVGEGRMRRTKGSSIDIPVPSGEVETNEDGSLSAGAIGGIALAVFSGVLCLCKCLADDEEEEQERAKPESPDAAVKNAVELAEEDNNNHEEEEHEQAKTKPPEVIKLGADKNQKLLDDLRLGAMIQMVLANKSNVTDREVCVMQKIYADHLSRQTPTVITSQDILEQVNEYKKTGGSIQQDLGSFTTPLTCLQKDDILVPMICVAMDRGSLLTRTQATMLTETARTLEVPMSHVNDLLYIICNRIHVDGTCGRQDEAPDEEMGTTKNVGAT